MDEDICKEPIFKLIFFKYGKQVRNFIFYKAGNMALAEDLVQEAFAKMWENCHKIPYNKAKSFLYTAANNLFLNQVEHQKVVFKFEQQGHSGVDRQTPQYLLEEEEFKQRLQEAIAALPEDQRTIFLMNRVDKKKYREIAELLEISIKTVEKKMHLALVALRKIHKKV